MDIILVPTRAREKRKKGVLSNDTFSGAHTRAGETLEPQVPQIVGPLVPTRARKARPTEFYCGPP